MNNRSLSPKRKLNRKLILKSGKKLLRNKYKKQNEDESEEESEESKMVISEFDIGNDDSNLLQYTQSKLSLNESRNSSEFHSKQQSVFNFKPIEKTTKKDFDAFWNNRNAQPENEVISTDFRNNFSVSKFNLEPESNPLKYQRSELMPTNYERENPHLDVKFNFMEEHKLSFGPEEDKNSIRERNNNFYASNPFNYNTIFNEIYDFSRKQSEMGN